MMADLDVKVQEIAVGTTSPSSVTGTPCASVFMQEWPRKRCRAMLIRLWVEVEIIRMPDLGDEEAVTEKDYDLFANQFGARKHFEITMSHKRIVAEVHERLMRYFPLLTKDRIKSHDLSKIQSFLEVVGYTEKWVQKKEDAIYWHQALKHHYQNNAHHPEHFKDDTGKQLNMRDVDLEESIVDMLARRWEKVFNGALNVSNNQLANVDPVFLQRYTEHDRQIVFTRLELIKGDKRQYN